MCPIKANPTVLPSSAPNCSSYSTTSVCMNTGYGVYADINPRVEGRLARAISLPALALRIRSICHMAQGRRLPAMERVDAHRERRPHQQAMRHVHAAYACGICMRHVNDGAVINSIAQSAIDIGETARTFVRR